jgi:uncharacterized protein YlaI
MCRFSDVIVHVYYLKPRPLRCYYCDVCSGRLRRTMISFILNRM